MNLLKNSLRTFIQICAILYFLLELDDKKWDVCELPMSTLCAELCFNTVTDMSRASLLNLVCPHLNCSLLT